METTQLSLLPPEVNDLAVKVSEQKQQEVLSVLNQIFTGTSDWEKQVDVIEVKGIEDKMSIQLADTARRNVKIARLAAEKIFDAKRDEVQNIKAEYDLEDKLWLKAKQVMQIKFKAIEDKAEWKAQFVQRYEAEQKELKIQQRIIHVNQYNPEMNRNQFENMTDFAFGIFISALKKEYEDRIESERKAEEERIAIAKKAEEERLRIIAENERLQKEAEAREKAMAEERRIQAEKLAAEQAKAKKEAEAREKAESELRAKKEAEMKAQKEAEIKAEAERKAKEIADKKAAAAPDKEKLMRAISGLIWPEIGCKTAWGQVTEKVLNEKFEAFKEWAIREINKSENSLGL